MTMTQENDVAIPECFSYFRAIGTPQGQAVKKRLERAAKTRLEVSDELASSFGRAMNTGDRVGDAYIAAAFAQRGGRSRARKDVEQALAGGIESVQDPSPELVAMFAQINTDPDWVDWEKVEHGAEVFRRYGKELYPYFGMVTSTATPSRPSPSPLP